VLPIQVPPAIGVWTLITAAAHHPYRPCLLQSAPSFARCTAIVPDREPFGRAAIPIDIAAPAYQLSVLKITRLIFFLTGLACDTDFLAFVVDLEALFLPILHPLLPVPRSSAY